jgi:hypothetical protein
MKLWMKISLWAVIALVLVLILLLNWKNWFAAKPQLPEVAAKAKGAVDINSGVTGTTLGSNSASGTGQNGVTSAGLDGNLPLTLGSKGAEVKELQTILNQVNPNASINPDGIFGQNTLISLEQCYGPNIITLNMAWAYFANAGTATPGNTIMYTINSWTAGTTTTSNPTA